MAEDNDSRKRRRPNDKRTVVMGQRFWQQAQRDMQVARRLLFPDSYYGAVSFAHQAAEKALKAAYWHLLGEEPPWKHDLVKCADLVAEHVGEPPTAVETAIEQLQPMFEDSRYPSGNASDSIPADLIDEKDAREAVRLAQEIMQWVDGLLQLPPGRTQRKKT